MDIVINGNSASGDFSTISELLEKEGLDPRLVVVELNGAILPTAEFGTKKLAEGDIIEIVQFVAGG